MVTERIIANALVKIRLTPSSRFRNVSFSALRPTSTRRLFEVAQAWLHPREEEVRKSWENAREKAEDRTHAEAKHP
jgi:hypothetical protein